MNGLYDTIKKLCSEHNITIGELTEQLGFGKATLSTWNTSVPAADKLGAVADYFNISVDYLLGKTDIPTRVNDLYEDKEILQLQRLRSNMSTKDKTKMMDALKILFREDFPDED